MSNIIKKNVMVKTLLKDIDRRKKEHYKKFMKYKRYNTLSKTFINTMNAVSVSSLVLTFTPTAPIAIIIAISSTSISSVSSAVLNSFQLDNKIQSHNTSYLQYADIYREYNAKIRRNHLTSDDYDDLLCELNARLGLIEDSSLPIRVISERISNSNPPIMSVLELERLTL